nr:cation efflux protein, CzcI-like [Acinetobacter proteolyticus]
MTVLLILFIFLGIWNVAAAYCMHERPIEQMTINSHFGHHLSESTFEKSSTSGVLLNFSNLSKSINVTDHHDHLPTCFHIALLTTVKKFDDPIFRVLKLKQKYYWSNFYQSPYLSEFNPPPESTRLLVG